MREIELAVGPYEFHARADGPDDGDLVVLLHGFPQTSWEWRAQLSALGAAGYRAVAPDQRGYSPGARPLGVEHYTMDLLVGDVLGIADALGVDRFHLVGHDWGAAVAWATAISQPDRLRSLTAVSVAHPAAVARALNDSSTDQAERSSYVEGIVTSGADRMRGPDGDGRGLRDGLAATGLVGTDIEDHIEVLRQPGALEAAINWYRANWQRAHDAEDVVDVPTLYIWSSADTACGPDAARWTAEYVRAPYQFEVIDDVSHWVPEMAPAEVSALLLEHLARWG